VVNHWTSFAGVVGCNDFPPGKIILADRTNGLAYATVLSVSSVVVCDVMCAG